MPKIPIGLELYSVRNDCAADLAGTLAGVAKMGYQGVEFAGFHNHAAADIKRVLDNLGLVCCGSHTGLNLLQGDELKKTVEFNLTLGNPYLIVPGLPGEYTAGRDAWRRTADVFNALADTLRPLNLWTGYHNHHTEFAPLGGEAPWDTFFGNTEQDVVMQLDMGNGLHGGADLVGILQRYPARADTVHLKPYCLESAKESAEAGFRPIIGEDSVPWAEVFNLCETTGRTRWYIVEYESDKYPPMEAVDKCLQALRGMGK
ncbi:MAG: sugar phosphate isomerase/epimerase [Armatimonadetes bacterium]|nr:sugar phosphate isomerase/epimerase [Armatimonadota bacterium]